MMSKSHYWVVCEAVDFIRNHGDESEKRALLNLELACRPKADDLTAESGNSAIEILVGFESLHTDKYCDLALEFSELDFLGKNNITGLAFHQFTAMNHFVNPYPETIDFWSDADGYSFLSSSKTGFDHLIVEGLSQYLGARVDIDNSPVFHKIRDYCEQDCDRWDSNFRNLISQTRFAPWTALSQFYYDCFINRHFEPLDVKGPNPEIVGIQLLGPVLHSLADACSVQHVRGTLGFGHSVWENYLKSMVSHKKLRVDSRVIRNFLNEQMFQTSRVVKDHKNPGFMNVSELVLQLSLRTADRMKVSTKQTWEDLWSAGDDFWKSYLRGPSIESDTAYLYHLAIASTVYALKQACIDLLGIGVLSKDGGLQNPELMPDIPVVQRTWISGSLSRSPLSDRDISKSLDPLDDPHQLLGFDPVGPSNLSSNLKEFNRLFGSRDLKGLDTDKALILLQHIQNDLAGQFKLKHDTEGRDFCPIKSIETIPLDSDLSAHWGIGTFRAPTLKELNDPELFSHYIDMNDVHCYKAHKLQLTQLIAGLHFHKERRGLNEDSQKRLNALIDRIIRLRDFDSYDRAAAFGLLPSREHKRRIQKEESSKNRAHDSVRESSGLWERIRNFFNIPMAALATAVAVALLLIMVYPRGGIEPLIGLSGETWEAPKPKMMAPRAIVPEIPTVVRTKAAIVLVFENFSQKPDQEFIDGAYRAIDPRPSTESRYEFISPFTIKKAISDGVIKADSMKELKAGLATAMQVSKVLIVTIKPNKSNFDVEAELTDLKSDLSLISLSSTNVTAIELDNTLVSFSEEAFRSE